MTYEERRQARIERFKARADKALAESEQAATRAHELGSVIPLGQPILVGHHSEGRDRRFRARIHGLYDKSARLGDKAAELAERARAAERNNAISSDDPEAVRLLKAKIETLERAQEADKAINAAIRKAQKARGGAVGDTAPAVLADLIQAGVISRDRAVKLARDFGMFPYHGLGVAGYVLTNRSAEIRRCRARLEQLEAERSMPEAEPVTVTAADGGGLMGRSEDRIVTVEEDQGDNRIRLIFPGKPAEAVRVYLKLRGFRWSPTAGAWQRQLNNAGRAAAADVVARLKAALEREGQQEAAEEGRAQEEGPAKPRRESEDTDGPEPCMCDCNPGECPDTTPGEADRVKGWQS